MIEIRWHGRGGQGAVTAAVLLAQAAINEGKYAQSFAEFGPERRGAPVVAFTRINDNPIYVRCHIYNPDVVVILAPKLMTTLNVTDGLKKNGCIIINTVKQPEEVKAAINFSGLVATVDATKIALEELNAPIVNTAILGSIVKTTNLVKLEAVNEALRKRFSGSVAEKNINAVTRAFKETRIAQ